MNIRAEVAQHENAKAFHDKCENKVTQTLDKG